MRSRSPIFANGVHHALFLEKKSDAHSCSGDFWFLPAMRFFGVLLKEMKNLYFQWDCEGNARLRVVSKKFRWRLLNFDLIWSYSWVSKNSMTHNRMLRSVTLTKIEIKLMISVFMKIIYIIQLIPNGTKTNLWIILTSFMHLLVHRNHLLI